MGEKGERGGPRGVGGGASMLKLQTNKNKVFWHCFQQRSAHPKLAGPQFRRKQQIPCSNVIFHTQAKN